MYKRQELAKSGFEIIDDGIKVFWHPGKEELEKIYNYGCLIGKLLK